MKYFILIAFLIGAAVAESDIDAKTLDSDKISNITTPIIDAFNTAFNTTSFTTAWDALVDIFSDSDATATAGITAAVTAVSALKTLLLGALSAPLQLANGVLALVGLVLLIVFLVEGGDFLSLIGLETADLPTFRSMGGINVRDVINHPMVNQISDMVYNAIDKWD